MTQNSERPREAVPARVHSSRAAAYARLAKLDIIDYYLGLVIAWSLLVPAARFEPRTLLVLALLLAGEVLMVAAMTSLDDVTGYRDGSDAANYGPDAPRRKLVRKPLIAGTLTEAQALRCAAASAGVAVLMWGAAVAVAPHRPAWAAVALALCLLCAVQYSWGLKLSYRGFQEIFLVGLGVGLLAAPYGLLSGTVDGFVLTQAVLFGMGPMLFGLYSNTNDIPGDARVGRRTVAVLTSPRGNAAFVTAMSALEAAVIIVPAVLGIAPWWFPLALLPVMALRAVQLLIGFVRGDILRARNLAIRTHRVTVILLVAVNLAHPVLAGGAA